MSFDQSGRSSAESNDYVGVQVVTTGCIARTAADTDEKIKKCRIIANNYPDTKRPEPFYGEVTAIMVVPLGPVNYLLAKTELSSELQNSLI